MPARKRIPFEFVLDALSETSFRTNPMFGCTAVYVGDKIVLILREKASVDDGVWVATTLEHHASLRHELPSMQSISVFGDGETGWQNIPASSPTFEGEALRACELVLLGDRRIGKVPAKKKRKPRLTAPTSSRASRRPAARARKTT